MVCSYVDLVNNAISCTKITMLLFQQFLYESETKAEETDHHQLLKDIQHGVKLRKVKTNDKSKPYIEGI